MNDLLGRPIAYLLTWSTYASRLHGDARGTVDDRSNRFGDAYLARNPGWSSYERVQSRSPPIMLTPRQREVVEYTILDICRRRSWLLWEVNARSNHVHVVVSAAELAPERVVSQFKAWSTRALVELGLMQAGCKVWTKGASTRYLWNEEHRNGAIWYVRFAQEGTRFDPKAPLPPG